MAASNVDRGLTGSNGGNPASGDDDNQQISDFAQSVINNAPIMSSTPAPVLQGPPPPVPLRNDGYYQHPARTSTDDTPGGAAPGGNGDAGPSGGLPSNANSVIEAERILSSGNASREQLEFIRNDEKVTEAQRWRAQAALDNLGGTGGGSPAPGATGSSGTLGAVDHSNDSSGTVATPEASGGAEGGQAAVPTPGATIQPTVAATSTQREEAARQIRQIAQNHMETWDDSKVNRLVDEVLSGDGRTLNEIQRDVSLRVGREGAESVTAEQPSGGGTPAAPPAPTNTSVPTAQETARQQLQGIAQAYGEVWDDNKLDRLTNEVLSGNGRGLREVERDVSLRVGRGGTSDNPWPSSASPASSTPATPPAPAPTTQTPAPADTGPAGYGPVGSATTVNGQPAFVDYDGYPTVRTRGDDSYVTRLRSQSNSGSASVGGGAVTAQGAVSNDAPATISWGGQQKTQQQIQDAFKNWRM